MSRASPHSRRWVPSSHRSPVWLTAGPGEGSGAVSSGPLGVAARLARLLEDEVDLRHLEPGQFDIDVELDQPLQLNRQQLPVPSGLLGKLVVGQHIGALIGIAQVRQPARRHRVDAKELGRFHAAVAGDDLLRIVHQDRVAEAELLDALCDLANLLF